MKINSRVGLALSLILLSAGTVSAQPKPDASAQVTLSPAITTQQREELERLRQEKEIHDSVEKQVERAFGYNRSMLNILLSVLTALPILVAISIWFLRSSVKSELVAETKKQLKEQVGEEVNKQLEEEVKKQLEREVAIGLKRQTEAFKRELERLKSDFLAQLVDLQNDAQKQKDDFIQLIYNWTPSLEESITFEKQNTTPELRQKLQEYTRRIESLQSANSQLFFTADDYIKLGYAFYFEYRYEDALASYDKAITIQPDAYVAWFGRGKALKELQRNEEAIISYDKALELKPDYYVAWVNKGGSLKRLQRYEEAIFSCDKAIELKPDYSRAWYNRACYYALQGDIDLASENLKQAVKLSLGKYRERSKTDPDFDAIREDECFKKIINE